MFRHSLIKKNTLASKISNQQVFPNLKFVHTFEAAACFIEMQNDEVREVARVDFSLFAANLLLFASVTPVQATTSSLRSLSSKSATSSSHPTSPSIPLVSPLRDNSSVLQESEWPHRRSHRSVVTPCVFATFPNHLTLPLLVGPVIVASWDLGGVGRQGTCPQAIG